MCYNGERHKGKCCVSVSYTHLMRNNHVTENPLDEIAGKSRLVPDGHGMLEVARRMGISLG